MNKKYKKSKDIGTAVICKTKVLSKRTQKNTKYTKKNKGSDRNKNKLFVES